MGFSGSWVAVRGERPESVLALFGLRPSGRFEDIPESLYTALVLRGWLIIHANDFGFADHAPLAELSESAEVVTCAFEDHAMMSAASGWRDGKRLWAVVHESARGITHLDATGLLPTAFIAIRDAQFDKQRHADVRHVNVDYTHDIPAILGESITGFRHDTYMGGNDQPQVEVLVGPPPVVPEPNIARRRSWKWWQRVT